MSRFFHGKTCETEYWRADRLNCLVELSVILVLCLLHFDQVIFVLCK